MAILIVVAAVVLVVVLAALVFNPVLARKSGEAVRMAEAQLGGPSLVVEPRAVGFASDRAEARTPTGQGCLAVGQESLVFVTTVGHKALVIPRSAISSVKTDGDPQASTKATLEITYVDATHGRVKVSWGLPAVAPWLHELVTD